MSPLSSQERAALRRNALVRTWVLGGVLLVFGLLHVFKRGEGLEGPVLPFASIWVLGALGNLGFAYGAVRFRVPPWFFVAEKVFDLFLVSLLAAITGGCMSPLTALFFLVVFSAQVDLHRKAAFGVLLGALAGCLAAELISAGTEFADKTAWLLWSVVFFVATASSARVVAPFRKEADRYEQLQALRREADALLQTEGTRADFPTFLLERLVELFGFQHGALLRFDGHTQELLLRAAVHIPPDGRALLFRQNVGASAQGVGVYAALQRRTTFLRDPASNPKLPPILRRIFEEAGSDRLASVPMLQDGELIGVALLSSAGSINRVEDEEVAFLEFSCAMIGGYLERWESRPASAPPTA